jgi:Fic family protein
MKKPEFPPKVEFSRAKDIETFFNLVQDTGINKKLSAIEKDYPYWDTFKHKVRSLLYDPKILWAYNKKLREKSISQIEICNTQGFQFKFNSTSKILKHLHQFDLYLGGILEGSSIIPEDDKNRFLISSIMEEAIASSQLEGAATTREIAKQMLRSNRKPVSPDEKMILNNYLTIKRVLELKNEKISRKMILELHSIISKDTLHDAANEGRFRRNNNVNVVDDITGEVLYSPPDYLIIEALIVHFCEFANSDDEQDFIHPIVKGIILHFLIGYIHPFADGNGRTARAIFYWYLISKGYWLVEYMSISRIIIQAYAQYGRAYLYSELDENDLTYFISYNLRCMNLALKDLQSYIQRKISERKNLFSIITTENVNERQAEILKDLLTDNRKSLTIPEIGSKFGVVYQTARTDLLGLESLGYLKQKKIGKKLFFFRADDFEHRLDKKIKSNGVSGGNG